MNAHIESAFHRLLAIARSDSPQGAVSADFLLAWLNGTTHGGFDPALIAMLPDTARYDLALIVAHLAMSRTVYRPLQFEDDLRELVERRYVFQAVSADTTAPEEGSVFLW